MISLKSAPGHFEIEGFAMYRGMESHEGLPVSTFDKFEYGFLCHYHHKSNSWQHILFGKRL
jgi:hypothetical protein